MRSILLLCGCVLATTQMFASEPQFQISKDGAALVSIVVSQQATPAEKHAASELAHFLEKVSGVQFSVGADSPSDSGRAIFVGPDAVMDVGPFARRGRAR